MDACRGSSYSIVLHVMRRNVVRVGKLRGPCSLKRRRFVVLGVATQPNAEGETPAETGLDSSHEDCTGVHFLPGRRVIWGRIFVLLFAIDDDFVARLSLGFLGE